MVFFQSLYHMNVFNKPVLPIINAIDGSKPFKLKTHLVAMVYLPLSTHYQTIINNTRPAQPIIIHHKGYR